MANQAYPNEVLANKLEEVLKTKVDLNSYMTVDTSLTEHAGMKKTINVYKITGNVEDLDMGAGNSADIEATFEPKSYEVKTTQGRFKYFDEQAATDPMVVDTGVNGLAKQLVNDFTKKAVAEWAKATLEVTGEATFELIVDAIAKLDVEDESGLFLMISPADKASFRKNLKDDLKYNSDFVRTGYIGSVAGVPVIVSKAVEQGKGYLASKEAVTVFIKKGAEAEQERNADTRENKVFMRKVAVVALTNDTKVVKLTFNA